VSNDLLNDVRVAISTHEYKRIRQLFKGANSADISEIFEEISVVESIILFRNVAKIRRSEVFAYLGVDRQRSMLDRLPDTVVVGLINDLDPVDRTKLLEGLPYELSDRFLKMLSPGERKIAKQLLSYPEDSVGRLMNPEFVSISVDMTASSALDYIRWNAGNFPEVLLNNIFVVDADHHYMGHIPIVSLIAADPMSVEVAKLMKRSQPGLSVMADENDAVDFFRKYDEPYIPVVDENGILLGTVESDDVFDVAEEEATEEIQQFGGQDALEDSYFQTPMLTLLKKRAGWLAILFLGMMFTTNALEHFEDTINRWSYLVFFLPMIISSGGNSGSQAASLMIRGLAVKEVDLGDWLTVLRREIFIGFSLGCVLGALGFLRVSAGSFPLAAGLVVSLSLVGVVLFGAVMGAMLPFILKLAGLDPAVSSSPVIASLVDLFGIVIFFNVSIYFLG